eukprot:CAMPEP_0119118466 /NCGR_PEP_ID=MMETSP1310-20130426/333_1 /TAXON_ID=464262 /ORGANISM="Genus nov. species nov., Strain RCC2339" /LENGTH=128 /DNA_ID=CAMNT_0007107833 /DNA_START=87 /DNA_END=473 /DNA_ORIENTATION=-
MAQYNSSLPVVDGTAAVTLEKGPQCLRYEHDVSHPLEAPTHISSDVRFGARMSTAVYGSHMILREQMEDAILTDLSTKPGLPSQYIHKDILTSADETLSFRDLLHVEGETESKAPLEKSFEQHRLRIA